MTVEISAGIPDSSLYFAILAEVVINETLNCLLNLKAKIKDPIRIRNTKNTIEILRKIRPQFLLGASGTRKRSEPGCSSS
jgi:hypothetical protein